MRSTTNPFRAFPGRITVDNLDDLFAFHRAQFGGFRMEDGDGDGGGDGDGDGAGAGADKAKTFTQDQVNTILAEHKRKVRDQFADYEDLKQKAAAHDAALEAAKTEQEKAVDAARKEGESTALERANRLLVRAKAETMAAQAKFAAPEAVVATLDLAGVKVADDGKVDAEALKILIDAAAESGAFVIGDGKSRPKPDKSQGGGGGTDTPSVSRGAELFAEKRAKKTASTAS